MTIAVTRLTGLTSTVALNNGLQLPVLGLGVFQSKGDEAQSAVLGALQLGYHDIDTAQYCVFKFLSSHSGGRQVMPSNWSDPATAFDRTMDAVCLSVKRLGVDRVDLMLLHAPGPPDGRAKAWRALDKLEVTASVTPVVNQIELHPWLQRRELVRHCHDMGIVLEAYSPLARPYRQAEHGVTAKLEDLRLVALAEEVGKSPTQVLIRWSLQKGFVPLPKSVNLDRQRANADVFDWELTEGSMKLLDDMEEGFVSGWDLIRDDPV